MTEEQKFLEWRDSHFATQLALKQALELDEVILFGMIESAVRGAYFHSATAPYRRSAHL